MRQAMSWRTAAEDAAANHADSTNLEDELRSAREKAGTGFDRGDAGLIDLGYRDRSRKSRKARTVRASPPSAVKS
jgi:hypothetical protein